MSSFLTIFWWRVEDQCALLSATLEGKLSVIVLDFPRIDKFKSVHFSVVENTQLSTHKHLGFWNEEDFRHLGHMP